MNVNFADWENPVWTKEFAEVYENIYQEDGKEFIRILESSPYEITVLSRLIAYLDAKRER